MIDIEDSKIFARNMRVNGFTFFFNDANMRFHASRLGTCVYIVKCADGSASAYFVTSEKNGMDPNAKRLYTVRVARMFYDAEGYRVKVETAGEYQAHRNGKAAHAAMMRLVEAHDAQSGAKDAEEFRRARDRKMHAYG